MASFWKRFGKPKPLIFAFFHYFFDATFRLQLGKAKNRKKKPQSPIFPLLGAGSAVVPGLLGREKERGVRTFEARTLACRQELGRLLIDLEL